MTLFEMLHSKYVVTFQPGDRVQLYGYGELDKFQTYNNLPATLEARVRAGRWRVKFDWSDSDDSVAELNQEHLRHVNTQPYGAASASASTSEGNEYWRPSFPLLQQGRLV